MDEFKVGDIVLDLDDGDIGRVVRVMDAELSLEIEILHTSRVRGLGMGGRFYDDPVNQQKINDTELMELAITLG